MHLWQGELQVEVIRSPSGARLRQSDDDFRLESNYTRRGEIGVDHFGDATS